MYARHAVSNSGWNFQAKSYSPPHTLVDLVSLGGYGVTLERAMYFVVVSYSRTVPYPSVRVQVRVPQHATVLVRAVLPVISSPRPSAACVMSHSVEVSCCWCRLTDKTMPMLEKLCKKTPTRIKQCYNIPAYITVTAIKTPRLSSASILANPHRWKR
jgi:hypothetical protein